MNKQVTFDTLRSFLYDLGFKERKGKDSVSIFEHAPSNTLLFFMPYQHGQQVDFKDLVVVRKFLDEKGLMDRDDFERWTWEQELAAR